MNREGRTRSAARFGGVFLVIAMVAGCSSSGDGVRTDRLAAQTSRPGMVVGDSLGVSMARGGGAMRTASASRSRGTAVASGAYGSSGE